MDNRLSRHPSLESVLSSSSSKSSIDDEHLPFDEAIRKGDGAMFKNIHLHVDPCFAQSYHAFLAKIGRWVLHEEGSQIPQAHQTFDMMARAQVQAAAFNHNDRHDTDRWICPHRRHNRILGVEMPNKPDLIHEVQKDALILRRRRDDMVYFAPAGPPIDPQSIIGVALLRLEKEEQRAYDLRRQYGDSYRRFGVRIPSDPVVSSTTNQRRNSIELEFPEYFGEYNVPLNTSREDVSKLRPGTVSVWPTNDTQGRLIPVDTPFPEHTSEGSLLFIPNRVYTETFPINPPPRNNTFDTRVEAVGRFVKKSILRVKSEVGYLKNRRVISTKVLKMRVKKRLGMDV